MTHRLYSALQRRLLSSSSTNHAFDRAFKQQHRNRAHRDYDYLRRELATRLVDRLDDIRQEFPLALDVGSGAGYLHEAICREDALVGEGGIGGVRKLVQLDSAEALLQRDADIDMEGSHRCETYRLPANEEDKLPFPDGTFDLVMSSASIHWVNRLPQLFQEIRRVLKPDGCFLLAMIGGTTLPELRASMVMAEMEREGGVSPHVGPFVGLSEVGGLLQSAGFALPTVDVDSIQLTFPHAGVLMEHLQRMGESNAALLRRERTSLDTFLATACLYDALFQSPVANGDEIEVSVQVIYAIGWVPHQSQQAPLERGSATHKIGSDIPTDSA